MALKRIFWAYFRCKVDVNGFIVPLKEYADGVDDYLGYQCAKY